HNDEARAGELGQPYEAVDLLLGGESADVSDDDLAARRDVAPHELTSVPGVEPDEVDTPAPSCDGSEPALLELPCDNRRRGQRERGVAVDPPQPAPRQGCRHTEAVPADEGGKVALEDGDGGDVETPRGNRTHRTEHRWRREVHHVGIEVAQRALDLVCGQSD